MSQPLPKIVSFSAAVAAEHSSPEATRLLAGRPVVTTCNHYADPTQQFFSGIWSSTAGKWRVSYDEHEFCSLLEGRVRLVSEDGSVSEFGVGESFVIPAGFTGTWETLVTCRKLYAIFLPSAPAVAGPRSNRAKTSSRTSPRKSTGKSARGGRRQHR
jgi:hypothetical protein